MLPKIFLDWFLKQIAKQLGKTAFGKFYNEFIRQPGNGDLDPYLGEYYGNLYGDADVDVSKIPQNPEYLGYYYGNLYGGIDVDMTKIPGFVPTHYNGAQNIRPVYRDPLILDLDGDGIETISMSLTNPVLFDHDGDGLKNGTGWIKPDDGFLVMDRNGNGVIDSGRELFGDSTLLYTGGAAADGFAALAQEDTNADGVINSLDANWSKLRVWQDLNSDGISQSGELLTMEQAGIAELNVTSIAHSQVLPNGNQIADLGTYIKTDGTTGTMGEVHDMADVNLTVNTFNREFTDEIPVSEAVSALPDMQGSGVVRDLQEAAVRPLKSIHMLRCAAVLGVAAYTKSTPHFSGFARLASERI